jgi:hypothetical protein
MTRKKRRRVMQGREKVDLYADVNLGVFGLLHPDKFSGIATRKEAGKAVSMVLKKYSFPSLNVVFSASGRLRRKDRNDLKVETRLEEMELRLTVRAMDARDRIIKAPGRLQVLGLYPYKTEATEQDPFLQLKPNLSKILSVLPSIPEAVVGIIANLGLSFGKIFAPGFPVLDKAFLASETEFGWYKRSGGERQQEGLHFGVAFLQVSRKVHKLEVEYALATDWKGGGVDSLLEPLEIQVLDVHHPPIPKTPQLVDFSSLERIPLVVPRSDAKTLLGVDDKELDTLIGPEHVAGPTIGQGTLLRLLGFED